MPMYSYQCAECEFSFEALVSIKDRLKTPYCRNCESSNTVRLIAPPSYCGKYSESARAESSEEPRAVLPRPSPRGAIINVDGAKNVIISGGKITSGGGTGIRFNNASGSVSDVTLVGTRKAIEAENSQVSISGITHRERDAN